MTALTVDPAALTAAGYDFDPACSYLDRHPAGPCGQAAVTWMLRRCPCGLYAEDLMCAPHAAEFLREVLTGRRGCAACLGQVRPGHLTWTAL